MKTDSKPYDVIVVGGGHAGIEAALASARMGARTLLVTLSLGTVGAMPCNPAIGGLGKGHLVREIDALGGEMARNIDATRIQFRFLNASKGMSVRSSRAQADRHLYQAKLLLMLQQTENVELFQEEVTEILTQHNRVSGVRTRVGIEIPGRTVVLTPGTFLNGRIHIGMQHYAGGRATEPAATGLSTALQQLGLELGRLKTGTVPRLDGRSINYDALTVQAGQDPYGQFSFSDVQNHLPQVNCYIAHTNVKTHDVIRANLNRSPLFCGQIEGTGPRYCPSIEDKVVRFPDRERHQIFLEPEGLNTHEVYPNGISTSLPFDVQVDMIRSIVGLENARIIRPGYAVEYDFVFPTQLLPSLETKRIEGLFLAGQINGTSGYEEAAAQGIIAGINAFRRTRELPPLVLNRSQAYIGVLIDDLVTRGTEEPYRMFTSRAEYRLLLREDNADQRLRGIGRDLGLVETNEYENFERKLRGVQEGLELTRTRRLQPSEETNHYLQRLGLDPVRTGMLLAELLKRPQSVIEVLLPLEPALRAFPIEVLNQVEVEIKYEGYIRRQEARIADERKLERVKIPPDMDFSSMSGLSNEVREKLVRIRPGSLGQAARIPGVTPASISILMVTLKKIGAL